MTETSASRSVFDLLLKAGGALAGLLMVAAMLIVCAKVFMRYGLGIGFLGADQISGHMLLFITFLGAAWVLSREEHVTIDIVYSHVPPGVQRILAVATSLLCAGVCLALLVYGVLEVHSSWSRGILIAAELEIPRWSTLFIIPLGSLFLLIQFLRRAWFAIRFGPPKQQEWKE